jgi:hypothetical protein
MCKEIVNIFSWLFLLAIWRTPSTFCLQIDERFSMSVVIRTSDGKVVGGFEEIQKIAEKIQNAKVIKKVAERKNNSRVTREDRSIEANECARLTMRIPKLLKQMSLCNWHGEVYSSGDIFHENFVGYLNSLLTWLDSVKQQTPNDPIQLGITALQMKDVLKWLILATKRIGFCGDLVLIDRMIEKL